MATLKTKLVCLEDYEQAAASKLKKSLRNYYSDGSCLGLTKTENVAAYKRLLMPLSEGFTVEGNIL